MRWDIIHFALGVLKGSLGMGSPASPLSGGRSILETRAPLTGALSPSPVQAQVDGLVGSFTEQATDWRALAAMSAGGFAYRAGRVGILGMGSAPGQIGRA